ncbi:MAG: DUF4175 family protein [Candidatus Zixiibacteriota bacterium]
MTPMPGLDALLTRLRRMRRTAIAFEWLTHLGWVVALASVVFVLLALTAAVLIPPSAIRVTVVVGFLGCIAALILWAAAKATIWSPRHERLALVVEKQHPELANRLIASLQLADRVRSNPEQYSLALIDLTIRQATQMGDAIDFAAALDRSRLRRSARWAGVSLGAALLLAILFPGLAQRSWEAYSRPLTDYSAPIPYTLTVEPGSAEAVKFDDFRIAARVTGTDLPHDVRILQRSEGGQWRTYGPLTAAVSETPTGASAPSFREFRHTIPQVKRDFEYYVIAGERTSPVYTVTAVDRPRVNRLRLEIFPPAYTGLAASAIDENDGAVTAPVGTTVKMRVESNRDLSSAQIVFSGSAARPMEVRGMSATAELKVEQNRSYHLALVDESGRTNPHPIEYMITAIPDRDPAVEIVLPGHNSDLNDNMAVNLKIVARDDYGFSRLTLHTRWVSEGRERAVRDFAIPNSRVQGERLESAYFWDLAGWGLMPEDVVYYYVEVADNDAIAGPKTASSKMFAVRLPSLDEMMAEFEAEREADINTLDRVMEGEREMARRIEELRRELAAKPEVDWDKQQKLGDLAHQGQELEKQLDQIAQNMQKQVAEAQQKKLASIEMIQKMMEAQQLFNEVATDEMKEAMRKLAEAMQKLDPKEIEQALANMNLSQEEMIKRLDRTIAYLKKLQAEQKVDAMIKRLEQMLAQQEQINKEAAESKKDELPDLAPTQEKLKSDFEQFAADLAAAESLLTTAQIAPPEQVSEFCRSAQKSPAPDQMDKTATSMKQRNERGSKEGGEQCAASLKALLEQMKKMQEQMDSRQREEMAKELREALDKVLYLSDKQEDMIKRTDELDPNSLSLRDMAAEQEALRTATDNVAKQMAEMAKKSTCMSSKAGQMLDAAMDKMQSSGQCLSDRRGSAAGGNQRDAMFSLNQVAGQLAEGMEKNSGQCKNPGSCDNPGGSGGEKMMQLSQKQGRLNQQMPGPNDQDGGMSESERETLKRLRGEQEAIKRGVEDLNSEIGSKEKTLGRLDKLAEEMQKVIEDMERSEVTNQTLDRQRRIYTRMLDFQNSLERQDYKEERKAQFGTDIRHASPAVLEEAAGLTDEEYERLLTRYQEEGYPKEYEETIKAYFRALVEARGK